MEFEAYDAKSAEARAMWGDTPAYAEYEKRVAAQGQTAMQNAGRALMQMLSDLGQCKEKCVSDPEVQQRVCALQDFITAHFYPCTDEIFAHLGKLYAAGEMAENIDRAGGKGTAPFVSRAIAAYLNVK